MVMKRSKYRQCLRGAGYLLGVYNENLIIPF